MNFAWPAIIASKRAYRRRLAARPIEEKLRILEALRDRALEVAAVRRAMPQDRGQAGAREPGDERLGPSAGRPHHAT